METRRNALLADLARDADIERSDFLVRAGEQLDRFMQSHGSRIRREAADHTDPKGKPRITRSTRI